MKMKFSLYSALDSIIRRGIGRGVIGLILVCAVMLIFFILKSGGK